MDRKPEVPAEDVTPEGETLPAAQPGSGPHHLPAPSIWPVVVALGVTLLLFGVVTSVVFMVLGAVIMIVGILGWIGDLRHAG